MKLHKYIIGLALLVSSSSCNFLDEEAYEFITPDNFYKTEADANAALTAVYNTFADEKSYRRYIWMGADFPGEAANANASAPSRVEMDNLTWTPTTDFCKNIWQISYSAIRRANNLLLNTWLIPAEPIRFPQRQRKSLPTRSSSSFSSPFK